MSDCAVWYCGESDSAQYHTAGRLAQRSMKLRWVNFEKLEYLDEILTKIVNIITHYSVAQAGWN